MRVLSKEALTQPLAHQELKALSFSQWKIITLITLPIVVIFEAVFWQAYSYKPWVAGFFAIAYSISLACYKDPSILGKAVRFASIPGIGAAILARSEYWVSAVFSNFHRLLAYSEPLPWTEKLTSGEKPWAIFTIAVGFIFYYWLVSLWPEVKNNPLPLNTLALCAATQTVIVVTITAPTVSTITFSIMLGAILTVVINKQYTFVSFAIAAIAPFYAMTNTWAFLVLLTVSIFAMLYYRHLYKPTGWLAIATEAAIAYNLLSSCLFFAKEGYTLSVGFSVFLFAVVFTSRFLITTWTVAPGFISHFLGLWFILLAFPGHQLTFLIAVSVNMALTVVLMTIDYRKSQRMLIHGFELGFSLLILSPYYGVTFMVATIICAATALVVFCAGLILRRVLASAEPMPRPTPL